MNYITPKRIIIAIVIIILAVISFKLHSGATELAEKLNTDVSSIYSIGGLIALLALVGGLTSNSKSS